MEKNKNDSILGYRPNQKQFDGLEPLRKRRKIHYQPEEIKRDIQPSIMKNLKKTYEKIKSK